MVLDRKSFVNVFKLTGILIFNSITVARPYFVLSDSLQKYELVQYTTLEYFRPSC